MSASSDIDKEVVDLEREIIAIREQDERNYNAFKEDMDKMMEDSRAYFVYIHRWYKEKFPRVFEK